MNAIDNRKKVFEYKLKHSINFKYVSKEEIDDKKLNNYTEICHYKQGVVGVNDKGNYIYDENLPEDKTPARKELQNRKIIKCSYAEKILEDLKQEVFKDLCKEYLDYEVKGIVTVVYYKGNFINPLIKNDICDKAVITITHEKIIKEEHYTEITRYLDVVLM